MSIYRNIILDTVKDTLLAYLVYELKYKFCYKVSGTDFDIDNINTDKEFNVKYDQYIQRGENVNHISTFIKYSDFKYYRRKIEIYKVSYEPKTIEEKTYTEKQLRKLYFNRLFNSAKENYTKHVINIINKKRKLEEKRLIRKIVVPSHIQYFTTVELLQQYQYYCFNNNNIYNNINIKNNHHKKPEFSQDDLKKELNTRKHIDDGKFSKHIRKLKAKKNYGKSKSKNR